MKVKLISRNEIAKDFWEIEFEQINEPINYVPGQFFKLTLINPPFTDNRENNRDFGFTTTPGKQTFKMLMLAGVSAFKKSLLSIPLGTEVDIDKFGGENNVALNPNAPIVFIAGGIGIAPVISMIRFYFENNLNNNLILFYANDGNLELPFINELQEYSTKNPNFKLILTPNINEEVIKQSLPDLTKYKYFIRGRKDFVIPTMQLIKTFGIEQTQISIEIFTGY